METTLTSEPTVIAEPTLVEETTKAVVAEPEVLETTTEEMAITAPTKQTEMVTISGAMLMDRLEEIITDLKQ